MASLSTALRGGLLLGDLSICCPGKGPREPTLSLGVWGYSRSTRGSTRGQYETWDQADPEDSPLVLVWLLLAVPA